MTQNRTAGHLAALLTILIWGTTFISTKILLTDFQPVEILFFRFVMGLYPYRNFLSYFRNCTETDLMSLKAAVSIFLSYSLCGVVLYILQISVSDDPVCPRKRRNTLSLPGKYPHQQCGEMACGSVLCHVVVSLS